MRTEKYYEQFGKDIGGIVKSVDVEIDKMQRDLDNFKSMRQNRLNNFAKDNSNYVIGQKLSDTVRIDDIRWCNIRSQISLIVFNEHYGVDNISESEVEQYLKQFS